MARVGPQRHRGEKMSFICIHAVKVILYLGDLMEFVTILAAFVSRFV